jgi:hypothetical protein
MDSDWYFEMAHSFVEYAFEALSGMCVLEEVLVEVAVSLAI